MRKSITTLAASCCAVALLILTTCGEKPEDNGTDAAPPGGAGPLAGGHERPGGAMSWREARSKVESMTTSADFQKAFADYPERKGVWSVVDSFDIVFRQFFRHWFETDPGAALEGAKSIPPTDGRNRFEAFAIGAHRAMEMPEEYYSTVIASLPFGEAVGLVGTATSVFVREDPDRCFDFIDTKLGQGKFKFRALSAFFSRISGLDFRQAVEYARRLEFEEDRKYAYESFMFPVKPPTAEDLAWAREQGMPEWALDELMSGIKKASTPSPPPVRPGARRPLRFLGNRPPGTRSARSPSCALHGCPQPSSLA